MCPRYPRTMTNLSIPAAWAPRMTCSSSGLPWSCTSGLGSSPERAGRRLPLPAARIKATLGLDIFDLGWRWARRAALVVLRDEVNTVRPEGRVLGRLALGPNQRKVFGIYPYPSAEQVRVAPFGINLDHIG